MSKLLPKDLIKIAFSDNDTATQLIARRALYGPVPTRPLPLLTKQAAGEWYDVGHHVGGAVQNYLGDAARQTWDANPWIGHGLAGAGIGGLLGLGSELIGGSRKKRPLSSMLTGALLGGGLGAGGSYLLGAGKPAEQPTGDKADEKPVWGRYDRAGNFRPGSATDTRTGVVPPVRGRTTLQTVLGDTQSLRADDQLEQQVAAANERRNQIMQMLTARKVTPRAAEGLFAPGLNRDQMGERLTALGITGDAQKPFLDQLEGLNTDLAATRQQGIDTEAAREQAVQGAGKRIGTSALTGAGLAAAGPGAGRLGAAVVGQAGRTGVDAGVNAYQSVAGTTSPQVGLQRFLAHARGGGSGIPAEQTALARFLEEQARLASGRPPIPGQDNLGGLAHVARDLQSGQAFMRPEQVDINHVRNLLDQQARTAGRSWTQIADDIIANRGHLGPNAQAGARPFMTPGQVEILQRQMQQMRGNAMFWNNNAAAAGMNDPFAAFMTGRNGNAALQGYTAPSGMMRSTNMVNAGEEALAALRGAGYRVPRGMTPAEAEQFMRSLATRAMQEHTPQRWGWGKGPINFFSGGGRGSRDLVDDAVHRPWRPGGLARRGFWGGVGGATYGAAAPHFGGGDTLGEGLQIGGRKLMDAAKGKPAAGGGSTTQQQPPLQGATPGQQLRKPPKPGQAGLPGDE